MRHPKHSLWVLLIVPLFLFMSVEEGHDASGGGEFAGKVVNFFILFGGLALVLYKPLKEMLGKRSADIREELSSAESRREAVEKRSAEAAVRLSGLDKEIGEIKAEAGEDARRVGERISAAAAAEAEKLKRFAELEIEEQVRGGIRELKSHTAERAASLARERIRKKLTPRDQRVLIDRSIEKLTRIHEKPGPSQ